MFKLSVQYKGGAGFHAQRETLLEALERLHNIALLDQVGGVVVSEVTITRED